MGIIAFGLPNLVGIGRVTVCGIQKNKIRVKEDISPRLRRARKRKRVVVEGWTQPGNQNYRIYTLYN